jgi:uncharacterized protein YbcI
VPDDFEGTSQAEPPEAADKLTEPDWSGGVQMEGGQGMRAQISNAMVGLKKEYYGKGPTRAKTFINDNYVFCVLEGGLTRNEETLLRAGEEHLVRQFRLRFQEAMAAPTTEAIERITRSRVIGYHSQIVFDPEFAFEIFVLDRPPGSTDS